VTILGNYEFEDIIYISSLSSSTADYIKEQMIGTKYTINKDSFEISSNEIENEFKISNPEYTKEEIDDDMEQTFNNAVLDAVSISGYTKKYKYSIHTNKNEKVNYSLYSMDDELWIASYSNTANDNTYIMYIFKLK
jgi:hypothetical protein